MEDELRALCSVHSRIYSRIGYLSMLHDAAAEVGDGIDVEKLNFTIEVLAGINNEIHAMTLLLDKYLKHGDEGAKDDAH